LVHHPSGYSYVPRQAPIGRNDAGEPSVRSRRPRVHGSQNDEIVEYIIARLRLNTYAENSWETLSQGYRTRFALARSLISNPVILILDEPLAFLDPGVGVSYLQDVVELIRWSEKPIAALVSSQHIHEIEAVANQILFIEAGHVRVQSAASERVSDIDCIFEIRCSLSLSRLAEVLRPLGDAQVTENLVHSTVTLPRGTQCAEALRRIIDAQASVTYFRDISQSTKVKFQA